MTATATKEAPVGLQPAEAITARLTKENEMSLMVATPADAAKEDADVFVAAKPAWAEVGQPGPEGRSMDWRKTLSDHTEIHREDRINPRNGAVIEGKPYVMTYVNLDITSIRTLKKISAEFAKAAVELETILAEVSA